MGSTFQIPACRWLGLTSPTPKWGDVSHYINSRALNKGQLAGQGCGTELWRLKRMGAGVLPRFMEIPMEMGIEMRSSVLTDPAPNARKRAVDLSLQHLQRRQIPQERRRGIIESPLDQLGDDALGRGEPARH